MPRPNRRPVIPTLHTFTLLALALSALLSLGACGPADETATVPGAPPDAPGAVEDHGHAGEETADAERGDPPELGELYRGHFSVAQGKEDGRSSQEAGGGVVFVPCSGGGEHWVVDQTGGPLAGVLRSFVTDGRGRFYAEVRAEVQPPIPEGTGSSYPRSIAVFELRHAAPEGVSACDGSLDGFAFRAQGNEPFWAVRVTRDEIVWSQPEEPTEIAFPAVDVERANDGTLTYTTSTADHRLELVLTPESCTDGMSGAYFHFTARATLDGRTVTGCAREAAQAPTAVGRSLARQRERAEEVARAKTGA